MLPLIAAIWFIFDTMCHYICHHQTERAQKCLWERDDGVLWLQDPIGREGGAIFAIWPSVKCILIIINCAWFLHCLYFVLKHSVEMFITEFEFKLYHISMLCGFTRLPGSNLPYTDFTILCPHDPTPPYFSMALPNCSTIWLNPALLYTLLSPPVLWLSLLYSTPLYAYWSYSLHYQTLFDCSVHYHGFVPAWLYCTLPYTTLTLPYSRWFYIWSIPSLYDVPCYRLRILHVRSLLGSTFILYHVLPNQGSTYCMQIAYYGGKVDGDRSIWYSSYSKKWETLYMTTAFFCC